MPYDRDGFAGADGPSRLGVMSGPVVPRAELGEGCRCGCVGPAGESPGSSQRRAREIAALTIISRELADDSSPEASATVGQAIVRDNSRVLDEAFFGSIAAPAPAGLAALAGVTTVDGDATDLDVFAEALSAVQTVGAQVSNFVTSPATALTLATLEDESGSSRPLLGNDPTVPTRRVIFGVPLLVSQYVADNTVWVFPRIVCPSSFVRTCAWM